MKCVKILHLADVHIGAKLQFLDSTSSRYRQDELLTTLTNTVALCKTNKIDALLISGDLFDNNNISKDTIISINNAFKNIPDTMVFIALGNHDFMAMDSLFLNKVPSNVHIFGGEWECIPLPEKNAKIYGRSFSSTHEPKSFLNDFPFKLTDDFINIMVMHGDLVSEGTPSLYNPITEAQLNSLNIDYVALGHIHKKSEIKKTGLTTFAYSGSPEGLGFDEIGDKGVYVGEVLKHNCNMSFISTANRKCLEKAIDISDCEIPEDIITKIVDELNKEFGTDFGKNLYKIKLVGTTDLNLDVSVLKLKLDDKVFCSMIKDATSVDINIEILAKENSSEGIFAKKMLEYYSKNGKSEIAEKAFRLGLQALKGEKINIEN